MSWDSTNFSKILEILHKVRRKRRGQEKDDERETLIPYDLT